MALGFFERLGDVSFSCCSLTACLLKVVYVVFFLSFKCLVVSFPLSYMGENIPIEFGAVHPSVSAPEQSLRDRPSQNMFVSHVELEEIKRKMAN